MQPKTIKKECLRIIPLGGMEEVGRNMVIFEYLNPASGRDGDIIIVDMGLQFPEENMPGIDYIIPNISYLLPRKNKIRGIIISHAHFDHIGAIPHLIPQLGQNLPIYGTDLTVAVIAKRQEDFQENSVQRLNLKTVDNNAELDLGIFHIEFFGVSHNIPGSLGTIIKTPLGIIVHTGDYKLDLKSDIAGKTDIEKIRELGKREVLALMSDSTNAKEPGYQFSEKEIKKELEEIVKNAKGRLIIGTFASLLGRLNQIIALAEKHKKKLVIDGRSMKTNIEIGRRLGYIKYNPKSIIPIQEIHKYPPEKIIILATGAQGEGKAVLMRIVNREHKYLRIEPGDTVIFSSSVIPGNERSVQNLTDKLYRDGAEVINYRMLDIHAGGHAKQEDLKEMIKMIKPKYLIPIEGNHSFLKIHAKLAMEDGFASDNILIADNGQVIEAYDKKMRLTKEYAPANYVMVDGLGIGDVKEVVLRDRQMLSEDGIFVVITVIDSQTGKVKGSPDIISRGFVYLRESQELLRETRRLIIKTIEETAGQMHPINWTYVKDNLRDRVGKFLFKKTERRPMVLPVVIEV
ncbi:MAG: ribonuclease J [Patescibacteria group bacterium]